MKNSAVASVEFYFKGRCCTPSARIDMDALMAQHGGLSSLYALVAAAGGIGSHSYEYEMMQAGDIRFDQAQGPVAGFIHDGVLDIDGFYQQWQENQLLDTLRAVVKRHLGTDDLESQPGLQQALLEAYRLGKQA